MFQIKDLVTVKAYNDVSRRVNGLFLEIRRKKSASLIFKSFFN